jgi:flagellar hook-associated protein 3 FlgL
MRISTNTIFDMGSRQIGELQSGLVKTQQQISTNRRILTPADDPVAAASALGMDQAISINDQFTVNRQNAKSALSEEESILQSVISLLQDLKTLTVNAGNAALDDGQRKILANDLRGRYDELLGLANSRDGNGSHIFGGYQTGSAPFSKSATGVLYGADQGQRMLQVAASRQMAISDSGISVFENNRTGNGRFVNSAAAANTGSGLVSMGAVTDSTQLTGLNYEIKFAIDATTGATTYDVNQIPPAPASPVSVSTGTLYVSGQSISFDGMRIEVTGTPANGDVFKVDPSTDQSIFKTLDNLLNTLSTPVSGSGGQTKLTNGLNAANINLDNALDNVTAVRTTIGSRLKEIDNLDSTGADLKVQYAQTLSTLQDIDQVEAYSRFTQQQTTLEAARQSFIKISGLSLFNMLT